MRAGGEGDVLLCRNLYLNLTEILEKQNRRRDANSPPKKDVRCTNKQPEPLYDRMRRWDATLNISPRTLCSLRGGLANEKKKKCGGEMERLVLLPSGRFTSTAAVCSRRVGRPTPAPSPRGREYWGAMPAGGGCKVATIRGVQEPWRREGHC